MKIFLFLLSAVLLHSNLLAADKDSVIRYPLPDSVKASSFYAHTIISVQQTDNPVQAGIQTGKVRLYLSASGKEKAIVFEYPLSAKGIVNGMDVRQEKNKLLWQYEWSVDQSYTLLIATASDSAANFSLCSGYVWLPGINKWKLIGTCKMTGVTEGVKEPASFTAAKESNLFTAGFSDIWCQRMDGSWKNMMAATGKAPEVNLMIHADSLQQVNLDKQQIEADMHSGKTGTMDTLSGIYYTMMKEGSGNLVSLEDTVTVHYKGYLYANNEVFDQTKEKPATFPLKRLIRGWQIGVPRCREGGKIKLVIPSALAYSIRTRAAKIPPNSILVFEIEVVKTKKP
jgi:FKBP-type peptidyl-prolyl cis-trans isomerase FkpA